MHLTEAEKAVLDEWRNNLHGGVFPVLGVAIWAVNRWNEAQIMLDGTMGSINPKRLDDYGVATDLFGRPIASSSVNLAETISRIKPSLWNEVKGVDMSDMHGWQRVADLLEAGYLLTVHAKEPSDDSLEGASEVIFQGVVTPDPK